VLAIAVAKLTFAKNDAPQPPMLCTTPVRRTALLSVEATARGLAVHQMAGFDPEKKRRQGLWNFPRDGKAIAALAIGYPGRSSFLTSAFEGS